uniref:Polysaccharide (De)acetylase n=1 Tax=Ignavibacterium album TaxID=591197 RepID=A0A832G7Q2_9BACT
MRLNETIKYNLKNIPGWKTDRKLIVFAVDDYGNVRVDSKEAREKMDKAGLKIYSRFDAYDTLETREDLEMLYETLSGVKDKNGRSAVFTPLALPCNINFEQIAEEGYREYRYELLPETFKKMDALQPLAYEGAWDMWHKGIRDGLMAPQFHGREHLNLKVFNEKLFKKNYEILNCLRNRSYTSISDTGYKTIGYTGAFHFWDFKENIGFGHIIETGLKSFKEVFGYKAAVFNAPAGGESSHIYSFLKEGGVNFIEVPLIKKEHLGFGKYKRVLNFTGKKNHLRQTYIVRNCVFEPTSDTSIDWVSFTIKQIEAAFRWNRPAVISSHRVNFCGHIDPANRKKGIDALKVLLIKIVAKWGDVEFVNLEELGGIVSEEK